MNRYRLHGPRPPLFPFRVEDSNYSHECFGKYSPEELMKLTDYKTDPRHGGFIIGFGDTSTIFQDAVTGQAEEWHMDFFEVVHE